MNCRKNYNNIGRTKCKKLLGTNFDSKLTFEAHLRNICKKKVSHKMHALSIITPYISFLKTKTFSKCFFQIPN